MPNFQSIIKAIEAIFARAGKRLHDVEFIGDEFAKRAIQVATWSGPLYVIGHAIGPDGHRHPVVNDPSTGRHYMVDKDQNLRPVD